MPKGRPKTFKPEVNVKDLLNENAQLKNENAALKHLLDSQKQQIADRDALINGLKTKYSNITTYVSDSLRVFYQGVMMAFEEGKR